MPGQLLSIAVVAAATVAEAQSALLTNAREIVTPADYPLVSLRNNDQGRVTVKLRVDETGLVSACTVAVSSGHSELDAQTCALFRARATFQPAVDAQGRPVSSEFTQTVNWKLADSAESAMPRTAWVTRTTVGYDSQGAVASCTIAYDGVGSGTSECPEAAGAITIGSNASPVRYEISEVRYYPADPSNAPTPAAPEASELFARQVSRVVISPDGQVISCAVTKLSGAAESQRDQCLMLQELRFRNAPAEAGPSVGTLVHSAYVRGSSGG